MSWYIPVTTYTFPIIVSSSAVFYHHGICCAICDYLLGPGFWEPGFKSTLNVHTSNSLSGPWISLHVSSYIQLKVLSIHHLQHHYDIYISHIYPADNITLEHILTITTLKYEGIHAIDIWYAKADTKYSWDILPSTYTATIETFVDKNMYNTIYKHILVK